MCIACVLQKGADVSEEEFHRCWKNNPDGGGFATLDESGNWIVEKSCDLEEFKGMFRATWAKRKQYSPALLHFRVGTRGTKDEFNCHPFLINPNVMMMHNGVIANLKYEDNKKSDTHTFATDYLSGLPYNFLQNPSVIRMIETIVGDNNKIAFLDRRTGKFSLINESKWVVDGDRTFSNGMFKEMRPQKSITHYEYKTPVYPGFNGNQMYGFRRECKLCHHFFSGKDFNVGWDMCDEHVALVREFIRCTGTSEQEARKIYQEAADAHFNPEKEAYEEFRKSKEAKEEKSKEAEPDGTKVGEMTVYPQQCRRPPVTFHGMTASQYEELERQREQQQLGFAGT